MVSKHNETIHRILQSRTDIPHDRHRDKKSAEEGGCGVTGFIASIPVSGRHIYEPSVQMHNRGNGKGGGIAAVGLSADDLGVTPDILKSHYILQVAVLDPAAQHDVEATYVEPYMDIHKAEKLPTVDDYRDVEGLEIKPPDVMRYVVRVNEKTLDRFMSENKLSDLDPRKVEDEFIYQNSIRLNQQFYASLGEQQAFVLSQGRNLMILKIVGYAEKVIKYYLLDDFKAHGWIAHQRYPTKGRVWHPGGAHPFSGLNEALVHNGDFANYHSVSEYLKQHNIFPQFLTDTEVAALLFDLLNRTFDYPMEYIIEAMAPTTEHDFDLLPPEKQHIYRHIQSSHMHGSPDGPWFFIIARNNPERDFLQLIGITDTSMLRPQVFALQDGEVQIGLICSEKQAIDATLESLSSEDDRFCPVADKYWNARGGSASDGGAFIFTVKDSEDGAGTKELICTNKFGDRIDLPAHQHPYRPTSSLPGVESASHISSFIQDMFASTAMTAVKDASCRYVADWTYTDFSYFCSELVKRSSAGNRHKSISMEILTHLNDRRFPTGNKKRSAILARIRASLTALFDATPRLNENDGDSEYAHIDWETRTALRAPQHDEQTLIVNAARFPPEGDDCDSRLICKAYHLGWRRFVCYGYRGQRFCGCGLSKGSDGVRIDVYDSSGDYLASGIDGLEIHVHGNGQDQIGQIMKSGKLVIYGDVGQTFMYGAKGGEVYVMGNAAGRPLINAVGRPRVVINGTCLDYLAESFMAGDPLNGGGFVIVNGVEVDDAGNVIDLPMPYPGSNLFSLASGGAIYLRDPNHQIVTEQLNGGEFTAVTAVDWDLIVPYLKENEQLFGISLEDHLLTIDGKRMDCASVYRKVRPIQRDETVNAFSALEEYGEDWQEAVGS